MAQVDVPEVILLISFKVHLPSKFKDYNMVQETGKISTIFNFICQKIKYMK
jgi:hypothetical protein